MRTKTNRKSWLNTTNNLYFTQVEGDSKRETGIDNALVVQSFRLEKTKPGPSSSIIKIRI